MPKLICPHCRKELGYEPAEVAGEERSMPLLSFFQRIEKLESEAGEMDKYLNTLGAENTKLEERVEKLEKLHPEA